MPETSSPTRAEEIRRYVELDALSELASKLVTIAESAHQGDESVLVDLSSDVVMVIDGRGDNPIDVLGQLWEKNIDEDGAEFHLAAAESAALQARLWSLLATDEARSALLERAASASLHAEKHLQAARERGES